MPSDLIIYNRSFFSVNRDGITYHLVIVLAVVERLVSHQLARYHQIWSLIPQVALDELRIRVAILANFLSSRILYLLFFFTFHCCNIFWFARKESSLTFISKI